MKRNLCAALAAALLMTGLGAARAQDDGPPPGQAEPRRDMGGGMTDRMKEKLGLTDEQAGKLKDAAKAHGEALKPLNQRIKDGLKKLAGQIKDKASDADVQASLDALKQARRAISDENEKFHESLASFLSPTQRGKMLLGMAMRMRRGAEGRGPRGRRGPRGGGGDHDDGPDDDSGE